MRSLGHAPAFWLVCLLSVLSCTAAPPFAGKDPVVHGADHYPDKLSDWQLLLRTDGKLYLNPAALDYDINMPLFTDYAAKYRSLWLPPGSTASVKPDQTLQLPVGTLISKTFFYPQGHAGDHRLTRLAGGEVDISSALLIETRLLVHQANGWDALTYVWRGSDAYLQRTGAVVSVPLQRPATVQNAAAAADRTMEHFSYIVPSKNECAGCHALDHHSGALQPIGLKPAQLTAADPAHRPNALQRIAERGWLATAQTQVSKPYASWQDADTDADTDPDTDPATVTALARDYLDSNCAHCHSASGPAKNSRLDLTRANIDARALGICKPPIAAGKGSGNRLYSIVPGQPAHSILTYRMGTTDPSRRMPETGRSLVHQEGLALVERWIAGLTGVCR